MRPHVEIIDERDYLWHPAELVRGEGDARQRNLAYDEEDGSVSTSTWFVSDWGRPAASTTPRPSGTCSRARCVSATRCCAGAGTSWCRRASGRRRCAWPPARACSSSASTATGASTSSSTARAATVDGRSLVVRHSAQMPWIPVEIGSPMRFDLGGSPVPGLFIKLLYRDPATGFYTRLIKAQGGWTEHPLAHHPCYEEAYCLEGGFQYNYGEMWPGTYFFRPPLIRHGDFTAALEMGCTWIVRSDSDLVDWYTEDARVEMHGTAVNWGADFPGTAAPRLLQPVRSRSLGRVEGPVVPVEVM